MGPCVIWLATWAVRLRWRVVIGAIVRFFGDIGFIVYTFKKKRKKGRNIRKRWISFYGSMSCDRMELESSYLSNHIYRLI